MASLTHMERAVPSAMQRSTASSSRQMHMVAPRKAFIKATTFPAAAKSVETRSAITKVGSELQLLVKNTQISIGHDYLKNHQPCIAGCIRRKRSSSCQ